MFRRAWFFSRDHHIAPFALDPFETIAAAGSYLRVG
jgi:hypothetical protein